MTRALLDHGFLATCDGHDVYWEMSGNPEGEVALVLHGGPGSGCRDGHYGLFDLSRYKVVLMDQRGCGRSRPLASETLAALDHNTTDHLIADIERLRRHLEVRSWLVVGGSWGSTLSMLYAQEHPKAVRGLVLSGVATTALGDLKWLYEDMGNLFPEAFDDFIAWTPDASNVVARIAAYADVLRSETLAQDAADAWCTWELAIFEQTFESVGAPWTDPAFRLGFARIVTHYFSNLAWRSDLHILNTMDDLKAIPAVMVHSRFDRSCPLRAPWELAKRWPAARLEILGGTDHSALSDAMRTRIRAATDGFAWDS